MIIKQCAYIYITMPVVCKLATIISKFKLYDCLELQILTTVVLMMMAVVADYPSYINVLYM